MGMEGSGACRPSQYSMSIVAGFGAACPFSCQRDAGLRACQTLGMGAGGSMGMMIPPRRHPSAGAQEAPSPSPMPRGRDAASSVRPHGKDAAEGGEAPAQELTGEAAGRRLSAGWLQHCSIN